MRPLLVILLMLVTGLAFGAGLTIVQSGTPVARIVVGSSPSAAAEGAAAELASYLKRISGAELPIVASADGPRILVGLDAATATAEKLRLKIPTGQTYMFNDEGYVVHVGDNLIILAGNETEPYEGTWYAVYDFLERLGCRWYFPGVFGEVVPSLTTITVPGQQRIVKPDFRVRDTWYSGHLASTGQQQNEFQTWKRRNRMSKTHLWLHCAAEEARFLQNPVDDSTYRLLPKEKYWETNPEYYALLPGGNRNERFLCMSNPDALQAAADTIDEYFTTHPNHHTFAFSPPDEAVLCNCADCTRALEGKFNGEGFGDISDPYFRFVFALADKVREKHPNRWITTMAYYNRCRPPQGVTGKHPNVLMQLASIQQCALHSYEQDKCWTRRQFSDMLGQWGELTAGQVFYEYDPHDWSHLQRPGWRSQSEAEDLRALKRVGGWGFSDEGQMAWMSTGLNYWLRARLGWNVNDDPALMVKDFCANFFGPSAVPMEKFYSTVEKALRDTPAHAGGYPGRDDLQFILSRPVLDQCERQLSDAGRLARTDPYSARVKAFRIYFDRIVAFIAAREAMNRGDYAESARQCEAMVDAVRRLNDSMLLQDAGPWGGSRSGAGVAQFAVSMKPWTDGTKGKLVAVLPEVAQFRMDPGTDGVTGRWYLHDAKDVWRPISMTSNWEGQGVLTPANRCYNGVAWYRSELTLPQAPPNARLIIPELAGTNAWVWCNGKYAGMTSREWDNPLSVDLSDMLLTGPNRITLRVQGEGGLTLPPFICVPSDVSEFSDKRTALSVFPAQWLFRTDPQQVGEAEGWQQVDSDESRWQPIPVPMAWEKTSVGEYNGDAWYRVRFKIPESAQGKRLVLGFGAVDEEAWVYLNGKYVGENTEKSTGQSVHRIWDQPFTIKATDAKVGAENVLVVKVRDTVGAGGIFMPVRLYAVNESG